MINVLFPKPFLLQLLVSYFRHSNVVILTTSNVTQKIDLAFVDRADIKQYIGPPSEKGIYNIYLSCLEELMKVTELSGRVFSFFFGIKLILRICTGY